MSDPRAALAAFIRNVMRNTRYHAQYPATVQGQPTDSTLDLLPDDTSVRGLGLSNVPIRHGLPAVTVKVLVGSRVLLGFEAGDPQRPYAALWSASSIEYISFAGGDKPVARIGDAVTCFWPPSVPITGTVGGNALVGTMTITSPAPAVIGSGAQKFRA